MFENRFSRRKGYTPAPVQGELKQLSDHARNGLWNVFYTGIYQPNVHRVAILAGEVTGPLENFFRGVWVFLYKSPIDEYPGHQKLMGAMKYSFLKGAWHFPFDIFEAVFEQDAQSHYSGKIMQYPEQVAAWIKQALEQENEAYTFVGGWFVEQMTPQEVESVETALQSPIEGIRVHFAKALQLYSDRDNPDFPNSIKESISAVEAACKELTGLNNATLGQALNALHQKRPLHQNLKDALSHLYKWTSDHGGIRHAIKDTENVERSDAQFMLVVCSAFVNYLLTR